MAKRPAHCYRYPTKPPYTRRKFIRGIPGPKIDIYDMGNKNAKFSVSISLAAVEACQIRHNALEAARVAANRYLTNKLGRANYHLQIRAHPHHVIRENKMMTFAGADRLQDGMRKAFGKAIGTAARVRQGQSLITVHLNPDGGNIDIAREALRRAKYKFATPCKIIIEKGEEFLS